MEDRELVKMLVNDNSLSDSLVDFYLELSRQFILNYCNIDEIPEALHSIMIQIAAVKLKANSDEGQSSLGAGVSAVTSVSEAGQSISWGRVTSSKNFIGDDDLISTFGATLNRFKRMDSKRHYGCCPYRTRRLY